MSDSPLSALPARPQIDFSQFGEVESKPQSQMQQRGAGSWLVMGHDSTRHASRRADATELEGFRKELGSQSGEIRAVAFLSDRLAPQGLPLSSHIL